MRKNRWNLFTENPKKTFDTTMQTSPTSGVVSFMKTMQDDLHWKHNDERYIHCWPLLNFYNSEKHDFCYFFCSLLCHQLCVCVCMLFKSGECVFVSQAKQKTIAQQLSDTIIQALLSIFYMYTVWISRTSNNWFSIN